MVLAFLLVTMIALAEPARVSLVPDAVLHAAWSEALFDDADAVFVFARPADVGSLIEDAGLGRELATEVRGRIHDRLSRDEFNRATSFFEVPRDARAFLMISNEFWDRLPPAFRRALYLDQLRREVGHGSHLNFSTYRLPAGVARASLAWRLRPFTVDFGAARRLARDAVVYHGRLVVPVLPVTWRHLNRVAREAIVESFLDDQPERRGLNLGDSAPPVPPFVARRVNRFARREANCFDIGVNLLAAADAPEAVTSHVALERHLAAHYREVDLRSGAMEPGDLMVYRRPWPGDAEFTAYNVSLCVAPGVIVTKNGLCKFCPYVHEDLLVDYARNAWSRPFTLTIYRHRAPGAYRAACEQRLR